VSAFGQGQQHATWTLTAEPATAPAGSTVHIRLAVHVEDGWHLYSASSPLGLPARFTVTPETLVRTLQTPPKRAFDEVQGGETETYTGDAAFLLEVKLRADAPAGPEKLTVAGRYQTCNDKSCVAGKLTDQTVVVTVDPAAPAGSAAIPAGFVEAKPPATGSGFSGEATSATFDSQGWLGFLLVAFGAGLACIFTPCVFPMIPITMSYFLNQQSGEKRNGVSQAVVFCLGIIVLFSGLGLVVTAVLGPVGIKQLGGNPWVNGFIAVLFLAFGLSLLGAFEITIPSSVLTKLNQSSGTGGFAGTLLMGLTFALSSFACVGPFVGTLLAASVGAGSRLRPAVGMVVFATGLALPFFLLALFPSYLKKMPRSGGWLARVKVVMGFVILAASLKYFSSVDQVLQWGFLTRERFLAAWIVLFAMAGLYLLGFLRMEGVKADENTGLGRLLIGMAFLIFAVSLWPGMSGGNLGLFDAYVPAAAESSQTASAGGGLVWLKDRYQDALDQARREHKLVFIDFTGYACANCHWMRANTLAKPEIVAQLKNFVLLELYTDNGDAIDDANSKLEADKFGSIANPYYVIVDPDEKLISKWDQGRTTDAAAYLAWLQKVPQPSASSTTTSAGIDLPQLTTLAGAPIDAATLNGKVVVVNFWATWCIPCVGELPTFNKVHRDFASKGVAVLGIDMGDEGADTVRQFLGKHPIDYTVGLGGEALAGKYKLESYPVTLIFDRTGKQVERFTESLTEKDLLAAVQKAL
jgi:thiol:disulfide interchange protein DsbD